MLTMTETAERLGAALRKLREGRMTQLALVAAIGESQSWLSRRENGETELTPSEIERIEQALQAEPGTLYELAGLARPGTSARAAIRNDPLLTDEGRRVVLGAYDAAVQRSSRSKRGRGNVDPHQ